MWVGVNNTVYAYSCTCTCSGSSTKSLLFSVS